MTPGQLRLDDCPLDDCHAVRLAGELDLATVPQLMDVAVRLVAQPVPAILLDLEQLTFIDSTGLHALITIEKLCSTHGCGFAITNVPAQARTLFEITGLDRVFPVCDRATVPRGDRPARRGKRMVEVSLRQVPM